MVARMRKTKAGGGRDDGDRIPISRFEGGGMSEPCMRVSHLGAMSVLTARF